MDDSFATSEQIDMAVKVLNELIEKYNIDTKRIYTTGQSTETVTETDPAQSRIMMTGITRKPGIPVIPGSGRFS